VADLLAFIAGNLAECRRLIGTSPWDNLTDAHPAVWRRQITRTRRTPLLNEENYVDDDALSQIVACLPALGADASETVMVGGGDTERELASCGDPQTMRCCCCRMLTGRRVSEICMCEFDCLLPAKGRAVEAAGVEQVARFRYAQSKIDHAPDTILVDADVAAIIEEQQQAIRARYPGSTSRYLFPRRLGNPHGDKPSTNAYTLDRCSEPGSLLISGGG
jgi:hypothetical protein